MSRGESSRRAPTSRALLVVVTLLAAAALAAGSTVSGAPPDGCRPGERAVAHRSGARPVRVAHRPFPCLFRTGAPSFESTVGVTRNGWVFHGGDGPKLGGPGLVVMRSKTGGRTWQDVTPLDQPSVIGDPFLYVDPATDRIFAAALKTDLCTQLSWSDDGGDSWITNPAVCGLTDHENVFTGRPTRGATVGYPNVVYLCANAAGIGIYSFVGACLKSLNGGLTFAPTLTPAYTPEGLCFAALGQGVAGPDGTIYLPKGWCGEPYLAISHDEGDTWTRVRIPGPRMRADVHQTGVGVDPGGNIYYTWLGENDRPYLSVSRTGGRTWSRPIMVGPPGLTLAQFPAIAVGGVGKVAIQYLGAGRDAYSWNGYITMTANALAADPVFLSATVNPASDPLLRGSCGPTARECGETGDFFDVVIDRSGRPIVSLVDVCSANCAAGRESVSPAEGVLGMLVGGPSLR